jgi:Phosphotransferase enzyme family
LPANLEFDDLGSPSPDAVRRLLDQAGVPGGDFILEPITGGGNNRVFCVTVNSESALLKAYFRHSLDPRDRLSAEFDFTRFACHHGVRQVPRPLACDEAAGLGLYEFIDGRKLEQGEVNADAVSQALAFFKDLNQHRLDPEARRLPAGSEACFCLADHVQCVERRLTRSESWQPITDLDREAIAFVCDELLPRWREIRACVDSEASEMGLGSTDTLPEPLRCLSPSDFGFHNALLEKSGRLRFIDFEYAGWDDPAKLACDFFCQPALPVPGEFWDMFLRDMLANAEHPEFERQRLELLLPVYRVKWVTILLNDFHPAGNDRRRFARPGQDPEQRKAQQLARARERLRQC